MLWRKSADKTAGITSDHIIKLPDYPRFSGLKPVSKRYANLLCFLSHFKSETVSVNLSCIGKSLYSHPWALDGRVPAADVFLYNSSPQRLLCLSQELTQWLSVVGNQVKLSSAHAIKCGAPKLRRVGYRDTETNRHYQFLTNNFTLSAVTTAAIYKDRWKVELFFKAIKHNLKIKAFVGTSKNAVLTHIWIALIMYLLVAFARYSARAGWTVQWMLRVLQLNLFERKTLREIFNPSPPPNQKDQPLLRLVL